MKYKLLTGTGLCLAAFVLACRLCRPMADFYALNLYPAISATLSRISSLLPFSLQETVGLAAFLAAVVMLVRAFRKRISWGRLAGGLGLIILWLFVGCYVGWACNYYRSDIFERSGCSRKSFDKEEFMAFLDSYTEELNASWCPVAFSDMEAMEKETHSWYSRVEGDFGLASPKDWQHPKTSWFSRIWTGAGVTGFVGPMTAEHHVMRGVPALEYPFTYAHEFSHVLGVSNEAEANWWAYRVCRDSSDPSVRYSGNFFLLGYVASNARRVLGKEEYAAWLSQVRPEILEDQKEVHEFWVSQRLNLFDRIQDWIYDLFLKSNRIGSGIANYSEIVSLVISIDRDPVSRQPR